MSSRYNSDLHHRRSSRLQGYDYGQAGAYFVTICTQGPMCLFGEVVDGAVRLNDVGRVVEEEWLRTEAVRANVVLDAFIIMPNHLHGIVAITAPGRGVLQYAPTPSDTRLRSPSQTIGAIIRGFKSVSTKRINTLRRTPGRVVWQRNYYDHIIRHEADLDRISYYIVNNPLRWELDRLHPDDPSRW